MSRYIDDLLKNRISEHKRVAIHKDDMDNRQMFSRTGDPETNRYTDTVVNEIKTNLQIPVFGGSTFSEFLLLDSENSLPFPCILVSDSIGFSFEYKYYANNALNNNYVVHSYSETDYPINYKITVLIYEKDEERLESVRRRFLDVCREEKRMSVPSLSFPNETFEIKLLLSNTYPGIKQINLSDGTVLYYCEVSFEKCQAVYHTSPVSCFDIMYNQRLQLRMLQRAQFGLLYDKKLSQEAMGQFKSYEALFQRQETKSLLEKAWGAVKSTIETPAYKQVKSCIACHKNIDRKTFDEAFYKITQVYPLYDKMMQGYTPEQIKEEILSISKRYNHDWNQMLNLIAGSQCPDIVRTLGLNCNENKPRYNIQNALAFYIDFMGNKSTVLVNDANEAYKEYLAEEARRQAEEAEERAARREEQRYSGGNSFVGDILKIAGGVALGNKISQPKQRKDGKRDLYGTSVCQRCKKKPNGIGGTYTPNTCIGCPAALRCTQQY